MIVSTTLILYKIFGSGWWTIFRIIRNKKQWSIQNDYFIINRVSKSNYVICLLVRPQYHIKNLAAVGELYLELQAINAVVTEKWPYDYQKGK